MHESFYSGLRRGIYDATWKRDFCRQRSDGNYSSTFSFNHSIEKRSNSLKYIYFYIHKDKIYIKILSLTQICDVKFTSIIFCMCLSLHSLRDDILMIPALLINMSTGPKLVSISFLSVFTLVTSEMSTLNAFVTTPNFSLISFAVFWAAEKFISAIAITHFSFARRKAVARPRPFAPPF